MTYQETLEARGIPADLAEECARILRAQDEDPHRDRTQEEQEAINRAYKILIRGNQDGHSQT
jgi:hypothetical protein